MFNLQKVMKKLALFSFFFIVITAASCTNEDGTYDQNLEGERPNIVLILADDMGYSDIGSYGGEIETPNLDGLADNGLRFTNFYNTARCSPTRASMLTGLYPHQAGVARLVYRDYGGAYQGYLNEKSVTMAEVLKEAGYKTMMSGKWHVGHKEKSHWPVNRGFDRFYGIHEHVDSYYTVLNCCSVYLDGEEHIAPTDDPQENLNPDQDWYTTDVFTDRGINFLKEEGQNSSSDQPFFLYMAYNAPHWPLEAPDEDVEKYRGKYLEGWDKLREEKIDRMKKMGVIDKSTILPPSNNPRWDTLSTETKKDLDFRRAIYAAQIDRLDQNIGRLINHLKKAGEFENTLILFLSDNGSSGEPASEPFGFQWGENTVDNYSDWKEDGRRSSSQGMVWANYSNVPFRKYKRWTHEGGTATPLIVHWPDKIKNEGGFNRHVGHVMDIMPTLVDVAGAEYPNEYKDHEIQPLEGKSLIPYFKGEDREPHKYLFWEHIGNRAVRKGNWKLVAEEGEDWELYNLQRDPSETDNVIHEQQEIAEDLEAAYNKWAENNDVRDWPFKQQQ